jgi:hypothetical protein
MDRGPAGLRHTLRARPWLHNWLLGGYGNDVIYGGTAGRRDLGRLPPERLALLQVAVIHAGNGRNVIYCNDREPRVDGNGPGDGRARTEGSGVIHCQSASIVVFTRHRALSHYRLDRRRRISFDSVEY